MLEWKKLRKQPNIDNNETLVYRLLCICICSFQECNWIHSTWIGLFRSLASSNQQKGYKMLYNEIPHRFKNHAQSIEILCSRFIQHFHFHCIAHSYSLIWVQRDNFTDLYRGTLWNQPICTKWAHFETLNICNWFLHTFSILRTLRSFTKKTSNFQ